MVCPARHVLRALNWVLNQALLFPNTPHSSLQFSSAQLFNFLKFPIPFWYKKQRAQQGTSCARKKLGAQPAPTFTQHALQFSSVVRYSSVFYPILVQKKTCPARHVLRTLKLVLNQANFSPNESYTSVQFSCSISRSIPTHFGSKQYAQRGM